ncbi:bifunctional adenosylcobinamide kinase/adenosylcobinamide-phosphate guanylyltransferase [Geminocystis sp. NIES-3709]|uniref:bifunctional adenosylcobinamide kinase/adenosylcobinamide-phosphate guanylyltransferase n=1 Tax=Geminocystis sp. NIES-3709 TaxID=1617448 RepID=UPI0005FC6753|nr:bifunctional adenosylcobinamide kinase/adenosylcobinamide-phosphate guanylyltransferase [Geminocystis sp. NIES-3709]BAQ64286.1 adenosylcobinamide-phosphate guanylyltransferase [Geminocystis sp. NIES-3709]
MNNAFEIILITGGANSGKSKWGEYLALRSQKPVVYIATAQKDESDEEWTQKILEHQQRRPKNWHTLEIPLFLADSIEQIKEDNCILIDSLGTWVANWLEKDELTWQKEVTKLRSSLANNSHHIILIAEETGLGVVPAYSSGRLFRSRLGKLSQLVGGLANNVYLTIGGYGIDVSKIGLKLSEIEPII